MNYLRRTQEMLKARPNDPKLLQQLNYFLHLAAQFDPQIAAHLAASRRAKLAQQQVAAAAGQPAQPSAQAQAPGGVASTAASLITQPPPPLPTAVSATTSVPPNVLTTAQVAKAAAPLGGIPQQLLANPALHAQFQALAPEQQQRWLEQFRARQQAHAQMLANMTPEQRALLHRKLQQAQQIQLQQQQQKWPPQMVPTTGQHMRTQYGAQTPQTFSFTAANPLGGNAILQHRSQMSALAGASPFHHPSNHGVTSSF